MRCCLPCRDSESRGRPVYSLGVNMEDVSARIEDLLTDPYLFANHFSEGKSEKLQGVKPMLNEFDP